MKKTNTSIHVYVNAAYQKVQQLLSIEWASFHILSVLLTSGTRTRTWYLASFFVKVYNDL